jgi:hypothetical protein
MLFCPSLVGGGGHLTMLFKMQVVMNTGRIGYVFRTIADPSGHAV